MKNWQVRIDTNYKTASITLEEGPWWAFLLEWLSDTGLPAIRIPWLKRIRITRDNEETTVADWYGETPDDYWQWLVAYPLFDFAWKHIRLSIVGLDYDRARKEFPDEYTKALARDLAEAEDMPSDEWIDVNIAEVCSEEDEP